MAVMTIRGLDDVMVRALKERAREEGASVNAILLKVLKEGLGLKKKARTVIHTDLDHLAGTWSDKDYKEFQKKIEDFERVDEDMWQ